MKRITYLFFVVVPFLCCKQNNGLELANKNSDSIKYYSEKYQTSQTLDSSLIYNTRILKFLSKRENDSINRKQMFDVATKFYQIGKWEEFKSTSFMILTKSIEAKDTTSIAKAQRFIAEYYKNVNVFDSSFSYYLKAERLFQQIGDRENLGKIYYKKGIIQFAIHDYLAADLSMAQALNLLKEYDDKQTVYQILSMIGIIANELLEFDKAIEYHERALALVNEYNLSQTGQEAATLNNIGIVYHNLGNYKSAIQKFKAALKVNQDLNKIPDLYARLLDNLGYSKLKSKDYTELPELFYKSLKIRDSLNIKPGIITSKIHLSEFYAQIEDTLSAQKFAYQALTMGREINSPLDILISLRQIANVDHKHASRYTNEYIKINDSLQQAERKSKDKFAKIQLDTKEILSEKENLEEQNRNLLYFFVGTLMIGVLLFVIRTQRARNRELLLKQAQQKANEDIYNLMITQQNTIEESRIKEKKRIAQELHDGVLGRTVRCETKLG